jgi:hypothetical protein
MDIAPKRTKDLMVLNRYARKINKNVIIGLT